MKYTREKIRDVVLDNIDRKLMCIPPLVIPMPRVNNYSEDLDLIGDLDMDSVDICELVYDSCSELGIDGSMIDLEEVPPDTIGDVIDIIQRTQIC